MKRVHIDGLPGLTAQGKKGLDGLRGCMTFCNSNNKTKFDSNYSYSIGVSIDKTLTFVTFPSNNVRPTIGDYVIDVTSLGTELYVVNSIIDSSVVFDAKAEGKEKNEYKQIFAGMLAADTYIDTSYDKIIDEIVSFIASTSETAADDYDYTDIKIFQLKHIDSWHFHEADIDTSSLSVLAQAGVYSSHPWEGEYEPVYINKSTTYSSFPANPFAYVDESLRKSSSGNVVLPPIGDASCAMFDYYYNVLKYNCDSSFYLTTPTADKNEFNHYNISPAILFSPSIVEETNDMINDGDEGKSNNNKISDDIVELENSFLVIKQYSKYSKNEQFIDFAYLGEIPRGCYIKNADGSYVVDDITQEKVLGSIYNGNNTGVSLEEKNDTTEFIKLINESYIYASDAHGANPINLKPENTSEYNYRIYSEQAKTSISDGNSNTYISKSKYYKKLIKLSILDSLTGKSFINSLNGTKNDFKFDISLDLGEYLYSHYDNVDKARKVTHTFNTKYNNTDFNIETTTSDLFIHHTPPTNYIPPKINYDSIILDILPYAIDAPFKVVSQENTNYIEDNRNSCVILYKITILDDCLPYINNPYVFSSLFNLYISRAPLTTSGSVDTTAESVLQHIEKKFFDIDDPSTNTKKYSSIFTENSELSEDFINFVVNNVISMMPSLEISTEKIINDKSDKTYDEWFSNKKAKYPGMLSYPEFNSTENIYKFVIEKLDLGIEYFNNPNVLFNLTYNENLSQFAILVFYDSAFKNHSMMFAAAAPEIYEIENNTSKAINIFKYNDVMNTNFTGTYTIEKLEDNKFDLSEITLVYNNGGQNSQYDSNNDNVYGASSDASNNLNNTTTKEPAKTTSNIPPSGFVKPADNIFINFVNNENKYTNGSNLKDGQIIEQTNEAKVGEDLIEYAFSKNVTASNNHDKPSLAHFARFGDLQNYNEITKHLNELRDCVKFINKVKNGEYASKKTVYDYFKDLKFSSYRQNSAEAAFKKYKNDDSIRISKSVYLAFDDTGVYDIDDNIPRFAKYISICYYGNASTNSDFNDVIHFAIYDKDSNKAHADFGGYIGGYTLKDFESFHKINIAPFLDIFGNFLTEEELQNLPHIGFNPSNNPLWTQTPAGSSLIESLLQQNSNDSLHNKVQLPLGASINASESDWTDLMPNRGQKDLQYEVISVHQLRTVIKLLKALNPNYMNYKFAYDEEQNAIKCVAENDEENPIIYLNMAEFDKNNKVLNNSALALIKKYNEEISKETTADFYERIRLTTNVTVRNIVHKNMSEDDEDNFAVFPIYVYDGKEYSMPTNNFDVLSHSYVSALGPLTISYTDDTYTIVDDIFFKNNVILLNNYNVVKDNSNDSNGIQQFNITARLLPRNYNDASYIKENYIGKIVPDSFTTIKLSSSGIYNGSEQVYKYAVDPAFETKYFLSKSKLIEILNSYKQQAERNPETYIFNTYEFAANSAAVRSIKTIYEAYEKSKDFLNQDYSKTRITYASDTGDINSTFTLNTKGVAFYKTDKTINKLPFNKDLLNRTDKDIDVNTWETRKEKEINAYLNSSTNRTPEENNVVMTFVVRTSLSEDEQKKVRIEVELSKNTTEFIKNVESCVDDKWDLSEYNDTKHNNYITDKVLLTAGYNRLLTKAKANENLSDFVESLNMYKDKIIDKETNTYVQNCCSPNFFTQGVSSLATIEQNYKQKENINDIFGAQSLNYGLYNPKGHIKNYDYNLSFDNESVFPCTLVIKNFNEVFTEKNKVSSTILPYSVYEGCTVKFYAYIKTSSATVKKVLLGISKYNDLFDNVINN